jgi:hypothetical protein
VATEKKVFGIDAPRMGGASAGKHPTKLLDDDAISVESGRSHSRHSYARPDSHDEANDSIEMNPNGESESELSLLPRFRSYGERRRLPLWQEFLYSKFRNDFLSVQQHIVEIPAYLLAQSEESIWLEVVEVEHYFRIDQSSYNVDCDGSPVEDLYWQMPSVRRERDGDDSDSDKEEMAKLSAVAGFANDKPVHSPQQRRGSVSSAASPARRNLSDAELPGAVPPIDSVGTASFPNKEPLASRGNTDEFSPVSGNRDSNVNNNKFAAANNKNIAATPDLASTSVAKKDSNGEDPHRPETGDEEALFHRTPSVDVNNEQPDGSHVEDLED